MERRGAVVIGVERGRKARARHVSSVRRAQGHHCGKDKAANKLTGMPKPPRRYSSAHVDVRRGNGCVVMVLAVVRSKDSDGSALPASRDACRGSVT
jgi:hypothetical protein